MMSASPASMARLGMPLNLAEVNDCTKTIPSCWRGLMLDAGADNLTPFPSR
jgi:hypothetical protein